MIERERSIPVTDSLPIFRGCCGFKNTTVWLISRVYLLGFLALEHSGSELLTAVTMFGIFGTEKQT